MSDAWAFQKQSQRLALVDARQARGGETDQRLPRQLPGAAGDQPQRLGNRGNALDRALAALELVAGLFGLLLLLFEDPCRYCLQALTVANTLAHEDHGAWSLLAVGVGNSATALNAWAQRVQPDVPVTQADKRLLARIGGVSATPLLLVVDPEGRVVRRVLGTQDPAALRELLR